MAYAHLIPLYITNVLTDDVGAKIAVGAVAEMAGRV